MTTDASRRELQRQRFNEAVSVPLMILSVVFVPILLAPTVLNLSDNTQYVLELTEWLIWGAFAFELVVNVTLAERRGRYLREHWVDTLIVFLPFLRPLRVVRSTRLLRTLRLLRVGAITVRFGQAAREVLRAHGFQYLLGVATGLLLVASAAVSFFEREAGGSIQNVGDALWWAVTTVTTVGYGDTYPVTPEGRGIGVMLMLLGISLFGVLTANVAAYFARPTTQTTTDELLNEIRKLEAKLDAALAERADQRREP